MELPEFVTRDTRICNEAPVFRNTRVPLRTIWPVWRTATTRRTF